MVEAPGWPAGWLGKNNAAWKGAGEAANGWLLFTDADVSFAGGDGVGAADCRGVRCRGGFVFTGAVDGELVREVADPVCVSPVGSAIFV